MEDLLYTDWPSFVRWFREAVSKEPETLWSENIFLGSPTDVKTITTRRPKDWELRVKSFQNLFVDHYPDYDHISASSNNWIEIWSFQLKHGYPWISDLRYLGLPYELAYTGERYYERHRPEAIVEYIQEPIKVPAYNWVAIEEENKDA